MKRTRRINILRSIRSSLNRFLSIVAIVALGSGFLAGLYAASPDMFETADSYLDDYRLYDLDMKAPVGFTEDDAAAVAALPGVEALLAARCADMVLETADEPRITATARVMGTLGTDGFLSLNRFRLTDGRMPERADECVVQTTAGRYTEKALHIGDLFRRIVDAGHKVGNHTYSHQKGWGMSLERYIEDVDFANDLIHSELFRPPYARITPAQARALSQRYKLVMWDVLSRDYSRSLSPRKCLKNVTKHLEPGAIVVFHDSEKSFRNMRYALPRTLDKIRKLGLKCKTIEL